MVKVLGIILAGLVFSNLVVPVQATALAATQIITITAVVAPARSIVVDAKGHMTTVYSNTQQAVTPKVHLETISGPDTTLTPQLRRQYDMIIAKYADLRGVIIPVAAPGLSLQQRLQNAIPKAVSSIRSPLIMTKI